MSQGSREDGFTVMEITIVLLVIGILCAIATPMVAGALAEFRLSGDARSVSNAIAVAKMRAASNFSRTRLYVNLSDGTHHVETWDKTSSSWAVDGGETMLSGGVSFGYDMIGTAPPSTQATIAQAPECLDDDGNTISGTACVMFNSRGVPVDSTFAPTAIDALYVTDGSAVYAITVAATGMQRTWHAFPSVSPSWVLNKSIPRQPRDTFRMRLASQRGTTLIETAIACGLLIVVTVGLLGVAGLATALTENHGHLEARTTEYAQDKMEQLLAIAYTDQVTNTVVFPAATSGGTGLQVGGSVNTSAPVNGYVDWLAQDGSLLGGGVTPPDTWFYERVWQITSPSSGLKQITVTSIVRHSVARSLIPRSTVVALKSSQF